MEKRSKVYGDNGGEGCGLMRSSRRVSPAARRVNSVSLSVL